MTSSALPSSLTMVKLVKDHLPAGKPLDSARHTLGSACPCAADFDALNRSMGGRIPAQKS